MSKFPHHIFHRRYLWCFFLALSFLLLGLLQLRSLVPEDAESLARRTGRRIERRLATLDGWMGKVLQTPPDRWNRVEGLPSDMVIYRYEGDSLKSWYNQFTTTNDEIVRRLVYPRMTDARRSLYAPLAEAADTVSFRCLGPKWYLIRSIQEDEVRVIGALELSDARQRDLNKGVSGVNPMLGLPVSCAIVPLDEDGSATVSVAGRPLFNLVPDMHRASRVYADNSLLWAALLSLLVAGILFLNWHRRPLWSFSVLAVLLSALVLLYVWGRSAGTQSALFSPAVYAGGNLYYSLGAVLLINLAVLLAAVCLFVSRAWFYRWMLGGRSTLRRTLWGAGMTLALVAVVADAVFLLRSIVLNSGFNMELYKLDALSEWTVIVYASFLGLLLSVPMLLQMLLPLVNRLTGWHLDALSGRGRLLFGLFCAVLLVTVTATSGFRKEREVVQLWANRLAIDRDLGLELQLRMVENAIAEDPLIVSIPNLAASVDIIRNRMMENYLSSIPQHYDVRVSLVTGRRPDPEGLRYLNSILNEAEPLADGSRFHYVRGSGGNPDYVGVFTYYSETLGIVRMLLHVNARTNREGRSYYGILGEQHSGPGAVVMPPYYSYARYSDRVLTGYSGAYAYPTLLDNALAARIEGISRGVLRLGNGYVHFVHPAGDNEQMVVSRPERSAIQYFVVGAILLFLAMMLHRLLKLRRRREEPFVNNTFKRQINTLLTVSLTITLVFIAVVSVVFVLRRNDLYQRRALGEKILSVQSHFEDHCRYFEGPSDFLTVQSADLLEEVGNAAKADIALYTAEGEVFRSTTPSVFDRMLVGRRMNEKAYYQIMYRHMRYFVHDGEEFAGRRYHSLYAPVFNGAGKMIAIAGVPYVSRSYDFNLDTGFHFGMVFTFFLILLYVSVLISTSVVDRLFLPLLEMGRKMEATDVNNLEYIRYDREDEVATLVRAYNRMVQELSESTLQLARTERDKAWSEMARQVAHEIKNPLTPLKLDLQRVIRLKQRGDSRWSEVFDEVSQVLLDQIDILADTANEFSTFAKLYGEEPVLLDLDRTLKEQIVLFDNREDIRFTYIGLNGAQVMGPRPQLIRVFVNLLSNAVQAVGEKERAGDAPGHVVVSLRHSSRDGYYDIVFEDDGPGVSEENLPRLFTPNFTTKSAGTGLGLAICQKILERCEASISYSRSFSLGGACFTIVYPKPRQAVAENQA